MGAVVDAAFVLLSPEGKQNDKKVTGFVQVIESKRDHGWKNMLGIYSPPWIWTQYIEPSHEGARKGFSFQINPPSYGRSRNLDCSPRHFLLESLEQVWWGYREQLHCCKVWGKSASPKYFSCFREGEQVTRWGDNPKKCGKTLNSERWILYDSWICGRISLEMLSGERQNIRNGW